MKSRLASLSLASKLTIAFVALLCAGLAVGTLAMTLILQFKLIDQVDAQLRGTSQLLGSAALDELERGPEESTLPSQYYVLVQPFTGGDLELAHSETIAQYGRPDLGQLSVSLESLQDPQPFTVQGSEHGNPWRVLTIPIVESESRAAIGAMSIGLPLAETGETIGLFLRRVVLVDIALISFAAGISLLIVQRALRPLREIESVAGRIAGGDLSQRVEYGGPPTTEMGSLALSLNTMLSRVEHSFETQRASEKRMRRFVSDASHELRTPLATVKGYGELYRLGGIPEPELPGAIRRMETEATRMALMVEDLLELARLDEGRPMTLTPCDLKLLAHDAAANTHALDPERPVSVTGIEGGSPASAWVLADENKMRQVLANLTVNAVHHTPPGTAVEIAVGTADGEAAIEVRDHGPGVSEDALERIFERFYRVDPSRSRASGGTGLGLAIVAAVVAIHGGTTRASTTPGGGLTIRVTLPASAPPADLEDTADELPAQEAAPDQAR